MYNIHENSNHDYRDTQCHYQSLNPYNEVDDINVVFGDNSIMEYPHNTPEEICCSPSDDPFISQEDSMPTIVSPSKIQAMWPSHFDNQQQMQQMQQPIRHPQYNYLHQPSYQQPTFSSYTQAPSLYRYLPESEIRKPRSKSVDTPYHDDMSILSDEEESTSQQSQFHMELNEEEVDDISMDDEEIIDLDYSVFEPGNLRNISGIYENPNNILDINVILDVSKTPCLDALVFCFLMRIGSFQTKENRQNGEIVVTNAQKFLEAIHLFCPKKSQTQNDEARIKAIKRWFDGIPAKRKRDQPFVMRAKRAKTGDVIKIIKKITKFILKNNLLQPAERL